MKITCEIPPQEKARFDALIRERIKLFRGTAKDAINARGLDLAFKALEETQKVDPLKIRSELGQIGSELGRTKKGKISRNRKKASILLSDNSLAARIIESIMAGSTRDYVSRKLREKLMAIVKSKGVPAAAKRLIGARVSSAKFLASGWLPAIRGLSGIVKDGTIKGHIKTLGVKRFGVAKGRYRAAKESAFPVVEVTSSAFKGSPKAQSIGLDGLRKGMAKASAGIRKYLVDKLGEARVADKGL